MLHTMRKGESDGLHLLVQEWLNGKELLTGIEIGCYAGESTEIILSSDAFVYFACIDPWERDYDPTDPTGDDGILLAEKAFDERFAGNPVVFKFKQKSEDAARLFATGTIDFLYIDGNHQYDYVMSDLMQYVPKVKPGGIIAGHDYNEPTRPDVTRAVLDYFRAAPIKVYPDNSWVFRKPAGIDIGGQK